MYAITPDDFAALVSLSRQRGIDPRDVAIVLYIESGGFNPASAGPGGRGIANGLNQMTPQNLQSIGFSPSAWRALSAAEQLPHIFAWWDQLAASIQAGWFPPTGADLGAINFLPGRYKTRGSISNPDATLTASPENFYVDNTFYDPDSTGAITVNTIRARQEKSKTGARWASIESGIDDVDPSGGIALKIAKGAAIVSMVAGAVGVGWLWWERARI